MKKLSVLFFISILVLGMVSCSKSFTYSDSNATDCIELGDFDFYARKLYTAENEEGGKKIITERDTVGEKEVLLYEVQYLLIKGDRALYITTIPSKYYYDKEDSYIIDSYYPNAFYLNNFYFGKITKSSTDWSLQLEDKKHRQEWDLQKKGTDTLELTEVNLSRLKSEEVVSTLTIKTKNAFLHPFIFQKIPVPFSFGFKKPYTSSDYTRRNNLKANDKMVQKNTLRTDQICLNFRNAKKKKVKEVLLRFNDTLSLSFGGGRVKFYGRGD